VLQLLSNIFTPLFEVTRDPNSHPQLHLFLKGVSPAAAAACSVPAQPLQHIRWRAPLLAAVPGCRIVHADCTEEACTSTGALHGGLHKHFCRRFLRTCVHLLNLR
jgi:hypothetical protein